MPEEQAPETSPEPVAPVPPEPTPEPPAPAVPVPEAPVSKKSSRKALETEEAPIKNRLGAEVRRPVEGPEDQCLATLLVAKLVPKIDAVKAEIKNGNPKRYSGLVGDTLSVELHSIDGRMPRAIISAGSHVYAVVDQFKDTEGTRSLAARLYAHIPAEINNLIVPWFKELNVKISDQTMIRPSAL